MCYKNFGKGYKIAVLMDIRKKKWRGYLGYVILFILTIGKKDNRPCRNYAVPSFECKVASVVVLALVKNQLHDSFVADTVA